MKIFSVRLTSLFGLLSFLVLFGASSKGAFAQDGEKLFKSYCAACHSAGSNMLVGPGLAGVEDRYDKEWLYKWIKNCSNPAVIYLWMTTHNKHTKW